VTVPLSKVVDLDRPAAEVSEDAIALAFAANHRDALRFDHDQGRWYEWDGVRWKPDRTDRGFHYCREISRRMGDGKKTMCKASVAAGAERMARADPTLAVTAENWDTDLFQLGTPGGVVDLRTGEVLPSNPDFGITKITNATPASGKPERWLAFLDDATGGDKEMIAFIQAWLGYCLTGDTREHVLLFVYGGGGNGKSVLLNTVSRILGDYAVTAAMETFTATRGEKHSTDVAMLRGARVVTASETEEGKAWAEARIKQMTGADPITARFMRKDNFTFVPQFKLTIVGNHAPAITNVDEAMRRRFRVIPFDKKPITPDRLLEVKLEEEWPQILHWMIEGCLVWQDQGLPVPTAMREATETYFDEQDVVGQWIKQECEVGPGKYEPVATMFARWKAFALANGEEPGTSRSFGSSLVKRGFLRGRSPDRSQRTFQKIALKTPTYDQDQGYRT
jgi:putative DNA primase/helicase